MEDDPSGFDYLGRPQPLAPQRINVAGGGGGVSAPATPSVGARAQAAQIILGQELSTPRGPDPASQALRAAGFAKGLTKLFPSKEATTRGQEVSSDPAGGAGPVGGGGTLIDSSRDFLGTAAGPTSFGDIDPTLVGLLGQGGVNVGANAAEDVTAAGFEAAEAAASGASAGAAAGAAGSIGAGTVLPLLGGAYSVYQDATSNAPDDVKALNSTIDAAAAVASIFFPPAALAAPVAKAELGQAYSAAKQGDVGGTIAHVNPGDLPAAIVLSGHANDIGGFFESQMNALGFGQADIPHKVREALDLSKHIAPEAKAMQDSLSGVKTLDDLYARLTAFGSGYTGGTSKRALSVSLPMDAEALNAAVQAGEVTLPKGLTVDALMARSGQKGKVQVDAGTPNAYYPVFTQEGFFKHLSQSPGSLQAGVQAGVEQGKLGGLNTALGETILQKYAELRPQPVMPQMPVNATPQVTPAGPAGSLDFAQSLLQDPTAGP